MLNVAIVVPFVYHCDTIKIFCILLEYLTWGNLAVYQTVQAHVQPFCYANQYFKVYPQF